MSAYDELKKNLVGTVDTKSLSSDINKSGSSQPVIKPKTSSAYEALRTNLVSSSAPVTLPQKETKKNDDRNFFQKYVDFSNKVQEKVAIPFVHNISKLGNEVIRSVGSAIGAVETVSNKVEEKTKISPLSGLVGLNPIIGLANNPIKKLITNIFGESKSDAPIGDAIEDYATRTDKAINEITGLEDNYVTAVSKGLGSSIPYLVGGMAMNVAKVPAWLASLSSSGVESLVNGYDDYKTLLEKGDDETTAEKKAIASFGSNLLLNYATNKLGGFFETLDKGVMPSLKRFLTVTLSETGQETAQQLISNIATGEKATTGLAETALVSLPISGIFGTAGIMLPNKAEKEFTKFVNDARSKGMKDDEIVKTVSSLFQSPEENVRKAVENIKGTKNAVETLRENLSKTALEQQKEIEGGIIPTKTEKPTTEQPGAKEQAKTPKVEINMPELAQTTEKETAFNELKKLSSKVKSIEELQKKINESDQNLEDVIQFHGTQNKEFGDAIKNGVVRVSEDGIAGKGFYVTSTPELADYFGKQKKEGNARVQTSNTPDIYGIDLRDLNIKKLPYGKQEFYDFLDEKKLSADQYNAELRAEGYDGLNLEGRGETVIFEGTKVKEFKLDSLIKKPKAQSELVKEAVANKPKTIKQIAEETGIKEPNIRRILGQGAKSGTFERVEKGVYILNNGKEDIAYIHTADAMETLPKLAKEGLKVDMVFLDIPYDTPAVKGGSRGVEYNLISVDDFRTVMNAVSEIVRSEETPVYYMFSQAESGMKKMLAYNDVLTETGFKPVAKGNWQKMFGNGKPVTNVRGVVAKPEGILLLNKKGEFIEKDAERNLDFTTKRPRGYQTEKPAELLRSLILQGTKEGDIILDPFAGSGVTGAEAVKEGRKAVLIEKDKDVVEKVTKPRVKEAIEGKKYERTYNLNNKSDFEYLSRMFSEESVNDMKKGIFKYGRREGKDIIESIANGNIISEEYKKPEIKTSSYTGTKDFYHGTSEDNLNIIKEEGFKQGSILPEESFRSGGYDQLQNSVSFSADPYMASRFTGQKSKGSIIQVKIKDGAKIVSTNEIEDAVDLNDYVNDFIKKGIDGIYIGGGEKELVIFNPKVIDFVKGKTFTVINSKNEIKDFISDKKETSEKPQTAKEASGRYYDEVLKKSIEKDEAIVIGADNLKDYFGKDYDVKRHPIYSEATNMLVKKMLIENKNPIFKATVGGTGSGKSDFLVSDASDNFNGVIYDSTAWNYEGLNELMAFAEKQGKDVELYGIIPDVKLARAYTFKREADGEHPVTEGAFIRTHAGAIQTMIKAIEDGYSVGILDTRGKTKAEIQESEFLDNPIDLLKSLGYNEEYVKNQINEVTKETYQKVISEGQGATREVSRQDRSKIGGSKNASIGRYRDDTDIFLSNPDAIKPIQFPELVRLAKELSGNIPFLRKYQKSNGMFYGRGTGEIGLNPELFKKENLGQLQKTLAHEIGHLIDYLPNQTMARGNLMGRLNTLIGFRKEFYSPAGVTRSNEELKTQMYALSKYWRPFEEATSSKSYNDYRKSPEEIYADFISAMFNDPRIVSSIAPTAYNVFFQKLDMKPAVKEAYFGLQDLLRNGDMVAERRTQTREMFKLTEQESKERQIQQQIEEESKEKSIWFKFKTQAVDITEAVREKVKEAEKKGTRINPDDNPTYYLEERNYLGGKIRSEVETKFNSIYQELQKEDMSWEDLGELMFYERILKGDRQEIANPLGYQPDFVAELMDVYEDVGTIKADNTQYDEGTSNMKATLGEDKFMKLQEFAKEYRENLKTFFDEGRKEGIYSEELAKMFEENAFYVPFKGAKYSGKTKTTFAVKQQKGTLGNIENPANTGIEKAVSIIRAIERNKVTRKTVEFLQNQFGEEVQVAKTDKNGYPIEPREKDLGLVTYMKDGKVKGFYVDKYIEDAIKKNTVAEQNMLISALRFGNSKLFRPLFITFNLGFQGFNAIRDFKRFWKNVPNMTILKALRLYGKSARASKIRAFGLPKNPSAKDIEAFNFINKLESEKLLGITYNDIIKGESIEDAQIDRILREVGIREAKDTKLGNLASKIGLTKNTPIIKQAIAILDFIEKTGNLIETMPKVAGVMALEDKMPPMEMRSFVRKYVGSPDFMAGGKFKPYMNEVFLFSNAIFQGIRSDYEIATEPKSRGAYWLKTTQSEILPKLLMLLATAGFFGEWLKELFGKIGEYDKANYSIIPLGIDNNGKAVYFRMPSDETGRLIGGVFWKVANAIGEPEKLAELNTYTDLINYAGGQVPSLTPTFELTAFTLPQFLAGNNPYDFFRGRNVLTDDQQQAGGMERVKPFLSYMFEQLGGSVIMKLYTNETVPKNPSLSEKVLSLPVVSNIAGRFIKTTNYGETEQLREISQQVKTDQARERIKNRRTVFDYVEQSQGKSYGEANALKKEMIKEIYGGFPKTPEDRTQARNLEKRFDTLRLRGSADARVDSLIIAGSNEEKVALLQEYKKSMSKEDYEDLKRFIIKNRIVSSAVFQALYRVEK